MALKKETELEMAARHVADTREIVNSQCARIAKLKAVGVDTAEAEELLRNFESNLAIFESHERKLRADLGK